MIQRNRKLNKKIVLITGIAGFIGSNVAKKVIELGYHVVGVDNLSTGNITNVPSEATFVKMDLSFEDNYNLIPEMKYDWVFHIAGQSGGIPSWEDNILDLHSNIQASLLMINYCIKKNIKNIVYTSSMSVYGNVEKDRLPVVETHELAPLTPYGLSKMTAENYFSIYRNHFENALILRLNNTYGPGQDFNNLNQGMVSIFIGMALGGKTVLVKGSDQRYRDFIYITDVVNVFEKTLTLIKPLGFCTINIATGVKTTVRQLLDFIILNIPYDIDILISSQGTKGDQPGIYCDISAAYEKLGWRPKIKLNEGIALTISSLLKVK
jgi:UDP-glucose 4-epimerase